MDKTRYLVNYTELFTSLKEIIRETENNAISDSDNLFKKHVNFFVKSYLITTCTYLESYLSEIACWYGESLNNKLKSACLPHNFLTWRMRKDYKEKDLKFSNADLFFEKEELSEKISGNPYRTIKAFSLLGVDLNNSTSFVMNKDIVNTIVTKRNNIIHHNDSATDISLSDLRSNIEIFLLYMAAIDKEVCTHIE